MKTRSFHSLQRKTGGVALLTVLLVVAIATITAVAMASRQQVDIRKTENLLRSDQAWSFAQGIDFWAIGRLQEDADANQIDSAVDVWNNPIPPTLVDGGQVEARIEDLQGRFNLNNLVRNGNPSPLDISRFRRLLEALELSPDLVNAVVDWIDSDTLARFPGGAEDDVYTRKDPPYRSANGPFSHIAELRLVEGIDETAYEKLVPHVCALPTDTAINLNTATIPVLMSLSDGITYNDAQALAEARKMDPFVEVGDALAQPAFAGLEVKSTGLGLQSDYFQVESGVKVDRLQARYVSIVHRQIDGTVQVIQRYRRGWFDE